MTLLLAQPDSVTPMWVPLAKAINRFLWAWSPWHLRDTLRTWGYAREPHRVLKVSYLLGRYAHPHYLMPGFREFIDREIVHKMASVLIREGVARRTEETRPWDLSTEIRYDLTVLTPWRP
jgi:hypothetical protein